MLSRRWAGFLVLVGVWSWIIWPRFAVAIWDDQRAWSTRHVGHGSPTSFLWVHALLIATSLVLGTVVGILGLRAWRASAGTARLRKRAGTDPGSADPGSAGKPAEAGALAGTDVQSQE